MRPAYRPTNFRFYHKKSCNINIYIFKPVLLEVLCRLEDRDNGLRVLYFAVRDHLRQCIKAILLDVQKLALVRVALAGVNPRAR